LGTAPQRPASPPAVPPQGDREISVVGLVVAAGLAAALLLGGMLLAAARGWLPARMFSALDEAGAVPATTDPETTAGAAVPIAGSRCAFTRQPPGAACIFFFEDVRGHLVQGNLAVPVPSAWLEAQPDPTAPDNARVLAALLRTPYAPSGPGLGRIALSVAPTFAPTLEAAGVDPRQLLAWLYTHVPPAQRPPWVPGSTWPLGRP
jgi:hypothetical protein